MPENIRGFLDSEVPATQLLTKGERGCRGCRTAEPGGSLVFGRCSSFVALQRFLARRSSTSNSFHPTWVGLTFEPSAFLV